MKICKKPFAGRVRLYQSVLTVILFVVLAVQSEATIYTLNSTTSTVTFDSGSGLTGWQVGGVQQLALESFYYSVGGGPLSPITSLGAPTVTTSVIGAPSVTATYASSGSVSVKSTFSLIGNQLSDSIKVSNLSGGSQTVSLFQFSDFILGGSSAAGSQNVNMFLNSGSQAEADQTGGGMLLVDQAQFVGTGGTTKMQANAGGGLFGPFLGGPPYVLDNATLTALGNAVYAYEWDAVLAPNTAFTISEISSITVPEPSALALIAAGMFALTCFRRRRQMRA